MSFVLWPELTDHRHLEGAPGLDDLWPSEMSTSEGEAQTLLPSESLEQKGSLWSGKKKIKTESKVTVKCKHHCPLYKQWSQLGLQSTSTPLHMWRYCVIYPWATQATRTGLSIALYLGNTHVIVV